MGVWRLFNMHEAPLTQGKGSLKLWRSGRRSEELDTIEEQINEIAVENPLIVVEVVGNIHANDHLAEKISRKLQGCELGRLLCFCIHPEGGLDINSFVHVIHDKIDFPLSVGTIGAIAHNAHVNGIAAPNKLKVEDILHDMPRIVLPKVEPCVAKSHIRIVVLVWVYELPRTYVRGFTGAYPRF